MAVIETSSITQYCITQARCRLCQFELADAEMVLAALDGYDVSCEFPFRRHTAFFDDELDVRIHMCRQKRCISRAKQTVWFHGHCYRFRSHTVTPRFLAATHYTFAPSVDKEHRRFDYIQRTLSDRLQRSANWARELPPELWLMIAGYLTLECATLTAEEQVHGCPDVRNAILDLTKHAYASYVNIDGEYYVKSLQNTAHPSKQMYCVLPAQIAEQDRKADDGKGVNMFIAEDHIGIRRVMFVTCDRCEQWCRNHPDTPGAWWRCIFWMHLPSVLFIKSDGLKMRDIESILKDPLSPLSRIGWQAPIPSAPTFIDLLTPLQTPQQYPDGLRMRFFDCNSCDITGYSILSNGTRVLAVLTHKQGDKADMDFHQDASIAPRFWMYMPIHQGEYLTDICRRAGHFGVKKDIIGITFSTNQGRTAVFGLYGHEHCEIQRVVTLPRRPCRVHFNEVDPTISMHSIRLLAVEQDLDSSVTASSEFLPTLPVSISPCPYTQSNEGWLYSSCSMQAVAEVSLCIDTSKQHRPVIGMLLSYTNGRRESVGQFRPDWMAESIMIGDTNKLYIQGKRTKQYWGYVSAVAARIPTSQEEENWLEVAQNGTLEW